MFYRYWDDLCHQFLMHRRHGIYASFCLSRELVALGGSTYCCNWLVCSVTNSWAIDWSAGSKETSITRGSKPIRPVVGRTFEHLFPFLYLSDGQRVIQKRYQWISRQFLATIACIAFCSERVPRLGLGLTLSPSVCNAYGPNSID